MIKAFLLILVAFQSLLLFSENVKIIDIQKTEENIGNTDLKYKIHRRCMSVINSSQVKYEFTYNYIDDPDFLRANSKAALPCIGDVTAKNTGIGLNQGWYGGGFIGISVNGKNIFGKLASVKISEGPHGRIEFSWDMPEGIVKAIFVIQENSDRIFGRIDAGAIKNFKSLELTFFARPGHHGTEKTLDRWCSTSERNWQYLSDGTKSRALDMALENWMIFYDSRDNHLGSSAILFDTKKLQAVQLSMAPFIIKLKLSVKPGLSDVSFILWGFPDNYKTPEEAYDFLNADSSKILEELKNFKF